MASDDVDMEKEIMTEEEAQQEQRLKLAEDNLMEAAKDPAGIEIFFKEVALLLSDLPKVKAAKAVRSWVDIIGSLDSSSSTNVESQIALCKHVIEWSILEKRTFLKHRIQVKLAWILLEQRKLVEGLPLVETLAFEVKKLEEKVLLVEVHLIQSKMLFEMHNIPRAKASLTACRANSNSVHISTQLQAAIEFTGGILAAAETDYHVAHSYFQEAYDGFLTIKEHEKDDSIALSAAMMLLMKLMDMKLSEFDSMTRSKHYLPLRHNEKVASVIALGAPIKTKDLATFRKLCLTTPFLQENKIVRGHLEDLEEKLLSDVIVKLLNAYSCCGMAHVAAVLNLEPEVVNRKLTSLILDGKLNASVAEDEDVITVHDPIVEPTAMKDALETLKNLSQACDVIDMIAQKPSTVKSSST
eukprot:GHVH01008145.1.p1 GENE.GHVH01008145.1~~GHVH01008145.1.p1  ORF type:complete len:412 (+),score=86.38 GHVH01008145.1:114-1349(+)